MSKENKLTIFEEFLTLWVILCIVAGVLIGKFLPFIPEFLSRFEYARVSIPVAILIWLMIYPMMLKIDFTSIVKSIKQPKGIILTIIANWIVKPFSMYLLAYIFFNFVFNFITEENAKQYIAGSVLLGAAPCTAMVFVWSYLTKGNPSYTLVQVAINDLIILFAFTPIVAFLLGIGNIKVPYDTLFLSVVLFVVIPLGVGFLTRIIIIKRKGLDFFEKKFLPKFNPVTIIGLLLTLIIIFSFQGEVILKNPFTIILIAIPLIIQTFFIFIITYFTGYLIKLQHSIASPSALIGASNFFELSVAVAISLFGLSSGATLATVVGVLVEVPVMLMLVYISNKTEHLFFKNKI